MSDVRNGEREESEMTVKDSREAKVSRFQDAANDFMSEPSPFGVTAVGVSGVEGAARYEQHRRQFDVVERVCHGDLIALVDLVDSGLCRFCGARRNKLADAGCDEYCDDYGTKDEGA
jgi:hypothetical protein